MKLGNNRRLANVKTKRETGLDYVMFNLDLNTPFGKKQLKDLRPYFPGEEEELRRELDCVQQMIEFVKQNKTLTERIQEVFMEVKDSSSTIKRCGETILSTVELFDIKSLLLQMRQICKLTMEHEIGDYKACHCISECKEDEKVQQLDPLQGEKIDVIVNTVPKEFHLKDTEDLLDVLDPQGDRMNTFYIYSEFSPLLGEYRSKKRDYELLIRKEQKLKRDELRKLYGIQLTPKFDIVVAKSHPDFNMIINLDELETTDQDYMSATLKLKPSETIYEYVKEVEKINTDIEIEEERVREELSKRIFEKADLIIENCDIMGRLDLALARAIYSIKHNLVKPEIVDEHIVKFSEGRNLQVEEIIKARGKKYCSVSIALEDGVTLITGANMGGKTISLKLAGQMAILAQYGFFVPAEKAEIGLSNYMQILIGDSQSVERGLSSFGSEMEELKEILDHGQNRSLILVDEIASGTNPTEGIALTRSIVDYLMQKPYITLITTHFEAITEAEGVKNMQVRGLADVDFNMLDREIRYANRKERINIISKYMDYRLYSVEKNEKIPKDALNIAKMLGISQEIIEGAQKYIK